MSADAWQRWSSDRSEKLEAAGLPVRLASKIAAIEIEGRKRLAEAIGGDMARRAEFAITTDGDDVKCFLVCRDALLSKAQRKAIRTEAKAVRAAILPA